MSDHRPTNDTAGDVRPLVSKASASGSIWIFAGGLGIAGILLFQSLEARRTSLAQPTTIRPTTPSAGTISSVPELDIPSDQIDPSQNLAQERYWQQQPKPQGLLMPPTPGIGGTIIQPRAAVSRAPAPRVDAPSGLGTLPPWQPQRQSPPSTSTEPSYAGPKSSSADTANDQNGGRERVQATRLSNPGTTVPKGTVIQAVLETALDSTRPGFARAIVSRDIYAFDGVQVLIPRGSRLVGEYKADVATGQKRALIQWQRLLRPDGVIIALDSPAADPLGRAGVGGKVNTHFFERFAGSILQSTLDIGTQLATQRLSRNTYILALPGTTQGLISNQGEKIPPTIVVRQGSSVSVFVARDLDFTVVSQ